LDASRGVEAAEEQPSLPFGRELAAITSIGRFRKRAGNLGR